MRRLEHLLVALDGTASSFHALEESIRLAHWGKARVTAITVAPSYEGDLSLVGVRGIKLAIAGPSEGILSRAMEIAAERDFPIEVVCEEGEAHQKIVEHAVKRSSDLIILGSENRRTMTGLILRSIGSRVIEHSPKDVLTIPAGIPLGWERILLATDSSTLGQSSRQMALELAVSYGSELKTVFLPEAPQRDWNIFRAERDLESADEDIEAFKTMAGRAGIRCETVVARGCAGRVIQDLARYHDILIVGLRMRKRFFGLIPGNTVDRIICRMSCPVLVVKARHCPGTISPRITFVPSRDGFRDKGSEGNISLAIPPGASL